MVPNLKWRVIGRLRHTFSSLHNLIKSKQCLDAWRWRKYMWLAIHDGAITLAVSLHEDMTKLISVRAGRCSWNTTAEPLVILTACLFSFVVGEHEMRPSCTCYHLNYHCRWKILLILINLNKKQGINTKRYRSSWENKAS